MRKSTLTWLGLAAGLFAIGRADASAFIPGNLVVYEANQGGSALSSTGGTPIVLVEVAAGIAGQTQATAPQVIALPTSGTGTLLTSGTSTSTGLLKLTNGGAQLAFTGHTANAGAANINTITARAVGIVDASGNYSIATTYTGGSGNQTRVAVTNDGATYYIGDQGGIYSNAGTASQSTGINPRAIQIYNGQTYAQQTSGTANVPIISSLTPALPSSSAVTSAGLTGITNLNNSNDFVAFATGSNGANIDSIYTTTTTGLTKWALVTGAWVNEGAATIAGGLYGITGKSNGSGGFDFFATSGTGGNAGQSVVSFSDTAAFNAAPALTATTSLFTAPANTALKGIDFAPVPEPASLGLAAIGMLALGRRRRA